MRRYLSFSLMYLLLGIKSALCSSLILTSGAVVQGVVDRKDFIESRSDTTLTANRSFDFAYTDPRFPYDVLEGTYRAQGTVSYGSMRARISMDVLFGPLVFPVVWPFSSGLWIDALTFDTATPAGTFNLQFDLHATGRGTTSGPTGGVFNRSLVRFRAGEAIDTTLQFADYVTTNRTINQTYITSAIPFVPGIPVSIVAAFGANVNLDCAGHGGCFPHWSGFAELDLLHTIRLYRIEVFDHRGSPIQNFTITSESGTRYGSRGVTTPEPASALFVGPVLAAIIFAVKRRRCRRR